MPSTTTETRAVAPNSSIDLAEKPALGRDRVSIESVGRLLHWILLGLVFGFLAIRAALQFTPHWDTMMYHLPSALTFYGLTTYEPDPVVHAMLEGIPHLAHYAQGMLVLATGRMSSANLINLLAVCVSAWAVWRVGRGSSAIRWYLTALLAVPLVILHTESSYIDLWNGAFLATAFVFLTQVYRYARTGGAEVPPVTSVVLCLLACAVSFNSKYQSWPFIIFLWGWLIVGLILLWRRDARMGRSAMIAAILLMPLFLFHPVKNAVLYGNPTHPIYNPVMVSKGDPTLQNPTIQGDAIMMQIPMAYWETPAPIRYWNSVFETSRLLDSKFPMQWSLDSGKGYPVGNATPHYRMGGWFYATVLVLFATIVVGVKRKAIDWIPVAALASCAFLAGFMPLSHALRYWLFVPIAASCFAADVLSKLPARSSLPLKTGLAGCALFVVWTLLPPFSINSSLPTAYAPKTAQMFWVARAADMDDRTIPITGAHPNTMFWAGPDFNTFRVRETEQVK